MGKRFDELTDEHTAFIRAQKIFFVATAPREGRVNLSPKGMDTFRVLGPRAAAWLNVTGSGNETAAHVAENGRMTVMFCAFDGKPLVLRLYGAAQVIHPRDAAWPDLAKLFPTLPGARQIFRLAIDLVQTSCGMAVPTFTHTGDRDHLNHWAEKQGSAGLTNYWRTKNQTTIDGLPTGIFGKGQAGRYTT